MSKREPCTTGWVRALEVPQNQPSLCSRMLRDAVLVKNSAAHPQCPLFPSSRRFCSSSTFVDSRKPRNTVLKSGRKGRVGSMLPTHWCFGQYLQDVNKSRTLGSCWIPAHAKESHSWSPMHLQEVFAPRDTHTHKLVHFAKCADTHYACFRFLKEYRDHPRSLDLFFIYLSLSL